MTSVINEKLIELRLPPYYDSPRFHSSIAWSPTTTTSSSALPFDEIAMAKLERKFGDRVRDEILWVGEVSLSIGKEVWTYQLASSAATWIVLAAELAISQIAIDISMDIPTICSWTSDDNLVSGIHRLLWHVHFETNALQRLAGTWARTLFESFRRNVTMQMHVSYLILVSVYRQQRCIIDWISDCSCWWKQ